MYAQQDQTAKAPREITLNERLNKLAENISRHCDRIESVLGRVNGTPPAPAKGSDVAQIRPTLALAQAVEALEQANQRLGALTNNIEVIA